MEGCSRCWSGFTARYLPFLSRSLGFSAIYLGVSLVIGLSLLEIPFSLPFSITTAIVMILLGAGTIFRVLRGWPCTPKVPAAKLPEDNRSKAWTTVMNYVLAFFIASLAILAGIFTMWIYFRAKKMGTITRLAMYIVLGASLSTIITHNILMVIQDIVDCCTERPSTTKGGLNQARPGNPLAKGALAIESRNKQLAIQFISYVLVGIYYGFMYGQLAGTEVANATPRARYDPWAPTAAYLEYSLPVAGAVGFLTGLLVSYMAMETAAAPLPPSAQSNAPAGGAPAGGAAKGGLIVGAAAPARDADPSPAAAGGGGGGRDMARAPLLGPAAAGGGAPAAAAVLTKRAK